MSRGVTIIVHWAIKPDQTEAFIRTLAEMFAETRGHKGFRNIRLLRETDVSHQFVMIQEWDSKERFQDYVRYRADTGGAATLMAMVTSPPQTSFWLGDPLASAEA